MMRFDACTLYEGVEYLQPFALDDLVACGGGGKLRYRGRDYVASAGSVLLLDCREMHEYMPTSDGWEFKFIHFAGQSSEAYERYITSPSGSPVFEIGSSIESYFDTVYGLVSVAEGEETCSEIVYRLLVRLVKEATHKEERSSVGVALSYITKHYGEVASVSELAEIAHMSRSHFSCVFKEATGMSPYEYLSEFRIRMAKEMLYESRLSVEEIAARCGFADVSSFIRAFKRRVGKSPSSYRKR